MTQANPQLEGVPRTIQRLTHQLVSVAARFLGHEKAGCHRIVSSLPPWPPRPVPPELLWRSRLVEYGGLAVATVCFAAAICATARIFYLAEEHHLGLGMFAFLAALTAGFARLGCVIVLAIGDWLEHARALNPAPTSPRCDFDPSPRPPPRDSTC